MRPKPSSSCTATPAAAATGATSWLAPANSPVRSRSTCRVSAKATNPIRTTSTTPRRGLGIHLSHQLDQLGVERAHFVGHDFGGPFAIFATLFKPERTASLSFINSGMLRGYRWHFWARVWRTPVLGELSMQVMNRYGMARTLGELPDDFIDEMWRNFDRRTRRVVLRLYRTTNTEDQSLAVPLLRALNIPSIVIWGDDDPFIAPAFAKRNLEAFPGATVHHVHGGHWPFIDNPEAVADLLLPYLREQSSAS